MWQVGVDRHAGQPLSYPYEAELVSERAAGSGAGERPRSPSERVHPLPPLGEGAAGYLVSPITGPVEPGRLLCGRVFRHWSLFGVTSAARLLSRVRPALCCPGTWRWRCGWRSAGSSPGCHSSSLSSRALRHVCIATGSRAHRRNGPDPAGGGLLAFPTWPESRRRPCPSSDRLSVGGEIARCRFGALAPPRPGLRPELFRTSANLSSLSSPGGAVPVPRG
jgi:hypothetical protein